MEIGWGTIPLVLGLIVMGIVVGAYCLGKRRKLKKEEKLKLAFKKILNRLIEDAGGFYPDSCIDDYVDELIKKL